MQNITYVTIGIGLIISIICNLIINKRHMHYFIILLASIIISFPIRFCFWVGSFMFCNEHITYTYSNTYQLRSLKDNISTNKDLSGAFVLCCGYVKSNETEYYKIKYISQDENDVYRINELENSNQKPYKIGFVTDNSNTLEVITKYEAYKHNNFYKWLYNKDQNAKEEFMKSWGNIDYIFHVSEDAVISDKNIDLE